MNDNAELRTLRLRLSGLERDHRRLRWGVIGGIVLIVVAVYSLIPAVTSSVAAETFVLNDANGTRRAEMSMVLDQPTVTLYDANGELRGAFRIGADGRVEAVAPPQDRL